MRRWWWILPWLGLAASAFGAQPRVEAVPGPALVLTALPPVLAEAHVAKHLTSGLTTTFAVRATAVGHGGSKLQGGARIEVRWEPWDEVFYVSTLGIDGRGVRAALADQTALLEWWQALRVTLVHEDGLDPPAVREVRLVMDMVPFSEAEQRDTRQWFADTLDQAGGGGIGQVDRTAPAPGSAALRDVFNLLMATSIQRRAVETFRWTTPVEAAASGGAS